MGLDDVGSIIIDLIREGRRLLTNTYQASLCIVCNLNSSSSVLCFPSLERRACGMKHRARPRVETVGTADDHVPLIGSKL